MGKKITPMGKFKWESEFSVGIGKFDEQHKLIIKYINELNDSLKLPKDDNTKEIVGKIIEGLTSYTVSHFLDEEVELYKNDYHNFASHKEEHDKLVSVVRFFNIRFFSGKISGRVLCLEIISVLTEWLKNHILKVDKHYGPFLNSKGVS